MNTEVDLMPRWMVEKERWEDGRDRYLFTDFELGVIAVIWFVIGGAVGSTLVMMLR